MKWYRLCSACGQGRLVVMRDVAHGRLYLHCEECEKGNPTELALQDRKRAEYLGSVEGALYEACRALIERFP